MTLKDCLEVAAKTTVGLTLTPDESRKVLALLAAAVDAVTADDLGKLAQPHLDALAAAINALEAP